MQRGAHRKAHKAPVEQLEEVIGLLALGDANLGGAPVELVIHLDHVKGAGALLVLGGVLSEPKVQQVLLAVSLRERVRAKHPQATTQTEKGTNCILFC